MIRVDKLTKAFGPKIAVNGVSFSVEKGEVLGFLGPNGAGKSTSMRMITGFIPPTSGTVTVGGFDIVEKPIEAKRFIGYLPENAPAYSDMTVEGFLGFAAEIRGLRGAEKRAAIAKAVDMCFLEAVVHQSIETLSKGYRHRTCFAQSVIHDPEVLILDEPTDGLDPNQKHEVRTLIRRMGEKKAIIFSTHILEEVEAVCSRAIIIDRGQIVANGTPAELKNRSESAGAVTVRVVGVSLQEAKDRLGEASGARKALGVGEANGSSQVRVYPKDPAAGPSLAAEIGKFASSQRWTLAEVRVEEGRLDEVFRSITLPETVQEKRK